MKILCVCTGNTCRSPMLAGLLRSAWQRKKGGPVQIDSAGTGAATGEPATPEAMACMAVLSSPITSHRSQHIDQVDLASYDRIVCMTSSHAAYARSHGVPTSKLSVVNADHGGVPDPFGLGYQAYQECVAILARAANDLVDTLLPSPSTPAHSPAPTPGIDAQILVSARAALDQAHQPDPQRQPGQLSELAYADSIERWLHRLVPDASPILILAARCQHLERWAIPRSSYPLTKAGYFTWRRAVQQRQGQRADDILRAAGCPIEASQRIARLVAKDVPKGDSDGQALEDAACLVFLESELAPFAAAHADYSRDKFVDIIRKTWRKMSARAKELAASIPLPSALAELVRIAASG